MNRIDELKRLIAEKREELALLDAEARIAEAKVDLRKKKDRLRELQAKDKA